MKRFGGLIGIMICFCNCGECQAPLHPLLPVMNGPVAYSIKQQSIFGFAANPASLGFVRQTGAGIISEKRYMLRAFTSAAAAAVVPFSPGGIGMQADYTTAGAYRAANFNVGYGRKLGDKAVLGVSFLYHQLGVSGYGNASVMSASFGAIFQVSEQVQTGFKIENPAGGRFGKNGVADLPVIYSFGCGLDASQKFFTGFEIVKAEDQPLQVNACFSYRIVPVCLISGGVSTASSQVWAGAGFQLRPIRLGIAAFFHRQLGITPALSIVFGSTKTKQ
ncbi:MAG: hypothetical protein IPP73_05610 [Chitinophagaceae bacterium]|nr:hypothetical protein [Chitinophagaceae bacterium]